jgi:hypothetical protein
MSDQKQCFCEVWTSMVHRLSSYWQETVLTYKGNMTLTFDPLTPKSIGVIYWPRQMHICSKTAKGTWVVMLIFTKSIWHWPSIPRPHKQKWSSTCQDNPLIKFEAKQPMGCQVIDMNLFLSEISCSLRAVFFLNKVNMTLTFWPPINKGHLSAKTNAPTKLEAQQQMGCSVIDQKPVLPTRSMWPWPLISWPQNQ